MNVKGYKPPQYWIDYVAMLKWWEENPVTLNVSEELHMSKVERKEIKKRGMVR